MDLIIYISLVILSAIFFIVKGPFWTKFEKSSPKDSNKTHSQSFPGAWKKGGKFTYDKGFKEYLQKGGCGGTWGTKTQTQFKNRKSKRK